MIAATQSTEQLRTHLAAVAAGGTAEDVHQLRVVSRHIASWLRLGRLRVLLDDLRWLRAAGGQLRDVDIVLSQDPPELLASWLSEERGRRQQHLDEVVASPRSQAILVALTHLPPLDRDRAVGSARRMARRTLERGDVLFGTPNDVEGFHRLRRSVRQLRYALEWLDQKTSAFKDFQDLSGRAADLSVALLLSDRHPQAESLTDYRALLEHEFAARRHEAVGAWPALRQTIEPLA